MAPALPIAPRQGPGEADAGKKINGIKRHILVDRVGLLVSPALTVDGNPSITDPVRAEIAEI